jgi:outer membrane lipoprotein-sorting protein
MKIEGKLGMLTAKIVINGDRKATIIPTIRYSKKEDIGNEPHKRQGDLDIGIVSDSIWRNYIVLDTDTEKSSSGNTYRITFIRENSRERKIVCWVESKTLKLLKLDKYDSDGNLISRYIYSKHSFIDGLVWVPGRIDVYGGDGKLAGTTAYESIKVNTGIPDSVFKI